MTNTGQRTTSTREPIAAEMEVDPQVLTNAQIATIRVLDAGVLPHNTNERDRADELLSPRYNIRGGLKYAEEKAHYHSKFPDQYNPLPMSHAQMLAAQLGFDPHKEWRKQNLQKHRDGIMEIVADRMIEHVEDAQESVTAATDLAAILEPLDGAQSFDAFVSNSAEDHHRVLADLTRLHETLQYATQTTPKKSRMNADLVNDKCEAIQDRITAAISGKTILQVRGEISMLLELENGRSDFWTLQLTGRPAQSVKVDKPAVRERTGLIEVHNSALRKKIMAFMSDIALATHEQQD